MIKIKTIEDVVNYQLCSGCGVCEAVEPDRYVMEDVENFGHRPKLVNNTQGGSKAFDACPGVNLTHTYQKSDPDLIKDLEDCWGPVYGVWEGYAADDDIRFKGSSGGAATALALFGLEKKNAASVIHTGSKKDSPINNESKNSTTKGELVDNAGSRYSPASPCAQLKGVTNNNDKSVFIGKPCDVAAVANWEKIDPTVSEKLEIKIGFFCAGTPSTQGNKALLNKNGVENTESVKLLKFRGEGWPGLWKAVFNRAGEESKVELTYAESWGFLQKFRQWRCYICPDHTAEFADIAVGDPWYRKVSEGEVGKSLIIARTKKGMEYILDAEKNNYIILETKDPTLLPRSQPNLIKARGDLWGRLQTLKLSGVPIPQFDGFKLFKFWVSDLTLKDKVASFYGTAKRIGRKRLKVNQKII